MKKLVFFVSLAILMMALPGAASAQTPSKGKVVEVRLTGHMPVGQLDTMACERFIKEAETRSKGSLKFIHYPAGQLAMDMKAYDLCKRGGIEMAQFFTNRAVGIIPETDLTIPYYDDADWWARRMYDSESGGGLIPKYIAPKFEKQGLHLMTGPLYSPEHSMLTKKPIRKMTDYNGLKIRTSGRSYGAMVETWGAKPVVMTSADVYMALQRRTIDAACSGLTSFRSRKWYEVMSHVQLLWMQVSTLDMIANLKWWNSLTAEHRKIIEESLRVATIWAWEECIKEVDGDIKFLKSKGLEVIDFKISAPEEWEKIRKANLVAQEKLVAPTVGPETWKDHIQMLNATKGATKTWRQVLETMKW